MHSQVAEQHLTTKPSPPVPGSTTRRVARPGAAEQALIQRGQGILAQLDHFENARIQAEPNAREAFRKVTEAIVAAQLSEIPIGRLRETTQDRIRLGPLEAAGFKTVGDVWRAGRYRLRSIPNVGQKTVAQVVAAAEGLRTTLQNQVRVRFDADTRPPAHAELLVALRAWHAAKEIDGSLSQQASALRAALVEVLPAAEQAARVGGLRWAFMGRRKKAQIVGTLERLRAAVDGSEAIRGRVDEAILTMTQELQPDQIWNDYDARTVFYNGLLIELAGYGPDEDATHGYIPEEIVKKVEAQPLDTTLLEVSLRGYQAFGARFALVQRQTILGDEMGLGKTIEALAAIGHLATNGEQCALVVCPASVLVNWSHEVQRHSRLETFRLHGPDRDRQRRLWLDRGGVAITTYDTLNYLEEPPSDRRLSILVADEAHYVKNPAARRTKTLRHWLKRTDRALFLTGTPMENRVQEFKTLVGHLRPEVAAKIEPDVGLGGADRFRRAVAPVYLRRNQDDVLPELPEKIEAEAWVQLGREDGDAYRRAVAEGNFMAMRRAAFGPATAEGSAKLAMLIELVDEAFAAERKVVVFSYFLDVLRVVQDALGERAAGPITGSVSAAARQQIIDEFSTRPGPAVLVSQIEAGGVGLNIQAASVVILTEPQWKPSTENQAIARCHRMGQARRVEVHRLLAEDTVDEYMVEIVARKGRLFDEVVRRSDLKDAAPGAVDVSDVPKTEKVASQLETERRIVELERRRLGVAPGEGDGSEDALAGGLEPSVTARPYHPQADHEQRASW